MTKTITSKNGGGKQSVTLDRHPKIAEYDQQGTEDHRYVAVTVKGWAFEDAATTTADDPEGRYACHTRGGTVTEIVEALRYAKPCQCGRCTS